MPKKSTKPDDKNIMDVSRPGESEPSANSRPIIVNRKPIVQDPMVREAPDNSAIPGPPTVNGKEARLRNLGRNKGSASISISSEGELKNDDVKAEEDVLLPAAETPAAKEKPADTPTEESASEPMLPSVKEIVEPDNIEIKSKKASIEDPKPEAEKTAATEKRIEPDIKPEEEDPAKESEKPNEKSEINPEEKSEDKAEDDESEGETKQAEGQDGIVDELAKQAMSKKQKQQEERDQKSKSEQMAKLVTEKKYFLPIGQVTRRRKDRKILIVLLLLIIAAVVGANFVLDAGLVKTNIKPLTNVIPD